MKKLILSVACLSIMLMSCNQSSKGKWTEDDISKARKDLMEGMNSGDESNVFSMKAKTKFCDCALEKVEDTYENFYEANSDTDTVRMSAIIAPCMQLLLEDFEKSLLQ